MFLLFRGFLDHCRSLGCKTCTCNYDIIMLYLNAIASNIYTFIYMQYGIHIIAIDTCIPLDPPAPYRVYIYAARGHSPEAKQLYFY